ncbi:MAG TPA: Flp pilus assembly protein CpaB [Symbiobacteriaceae bacterium]|nr:Flp pilus assembly protein CpaB [Symbiobacteriaceae bacterium]
MRGSFGRYAILLALVAALFAGLGHINVLKGMQKTATVLVVSKEIKPYELLSEEKVRKEEKAVGAVTKDALTSLDQIKDQYARGLIVPGEVLRQAHLAPAAGGHLATRLTKEGDGSLRAMALSVSADTGVANTLKPGDRVDILVSLQVATATGPSTYSKIIAQGVPILYSSVSSTDVSQDMSGEEATVVLEVKPELAEELAFAKGSGTVWLLTVPQGASDHRTAGMDMEAFRQKYGLAVASGTNTAVTAAKKGGN